MGFWKKIFGMQSSVQSYANSAAPYTQANFGVKPAAAAPAKPAVSVKRGGWGNGIGKQTSSDSDSITVYSGNGEPLHLTAVHLKGCGGEGRVYSIPVRTSRPCVCKIYKESTIQDAKRLQTLRARILDMTRLKDKLPGDGYAWPRMAVFDAQKRVIGFAMNRCEGVPFQALFGGPAMVHKYFPSWDRSDLVKTAIRFIERVELLASQGVLVNDFNPANFLVNAAGEVSFIDCDSYQVGSHITKTYFASNVAPELLNHPEDFSQKRNLHHVEFGVAVTVFQLLMCGLHPYSYFDPSHKKVCGTPDENLKHGYCPLGIGAGCRFPVGNWYNLWSYLTYKLKNLFIRSLKDGHGDPSQRGTFAEWKYALTGLLCEMNKDPLRKSLTPATAKQKSSEYPEKN